MEPQQIGPYKFKTKYGMYDVVFIISAYNFDPKQPAIRAVDDDTGEPIMVCSVMMEGQTLPEDHLFIKAWSENEGVDETLVALGLIGPEVGGVPAGFCRASIHPMQGPLLEAWQKFKVTVAN